MKDRFTNQPATFGLSLADFSEDSPFFRNQHGPSKRLDAWTDRQGTRAHFFRGWEAGDFDSRPGFRGDSGVYGLGAAGSAGAGAAGAAAAGGAAGVGGAGGGVAAGTGGAGGGGVGSVP